MLTSNYLIALCIIKIYRYFVMDNSKMNNSPAVSCEKTDLLTAVNILAESDQADKLVQKLKLAFEVIGRDVPIRLTGSMEGLNPLLDLMIQDLDASERVLDLVDRKRKEANLPALAESFDRKAYMRELMAKKRDRQRRLVGLANMLRSDSDKIHGADRENFEREHADRWQQWRIDAQNKMRETLGRRLSQAEITSVIGDLWLRVDAELDAYENFVHKEILKPILARSKFEFGLQLVAVRE